MGAGRLTELKPNSHTTRSGQPGRELNLEVKIMKKNLRYIVIGHDEKQICTYGIGWSITEILAAHPTAKNISLVDKTRPDIDISTVIAAELRTLIETGKRMD